MKHKRCPFCGAPAEEGKEPPHWVRCANQCEAGARWMHPNAWNRRHSVNDKRRNILNAKLRNKLAHQAAIIAALMKLVNALEEVNDNIKNPRRDAGHSLKQAEARLMAAYAKLAEVQKCST